MTALQIFEVVFPAFALVAVGYGVGAFLRMDLATLTDTVVYLAAPALIFAAISQGPLDSGQALVMAAGAVTIVLGVGALVRAGAWLAGVSPGALYLPAMFMNAGNMQLPLSLFAFGEQGLRLGVVFFVTITILQSTIGVAIASGGGDYREMFRLPHVYALTAALAVRSVAADVPAAVMRPVELLGDMAIPMMLLALGLRLRTVRIASWRGPLWISAARIGGGFGVGWLFVTAAGVEGTARGCLLLASVMPAAVVNFVFAEKYANSPGDVATAVVVSTLVSLAAIPLVLAVAI
jgi:predicted permease